MKNLSLKTIMVCFVFNIAVLMTCMSSMKLLAASAEMKIHGIYLKTGDKGDSVLLESKGNYLLMDIGSASHAPAIIAYLNTLKVKNIQIYLSHLHMDHVGGRSGGMIDGLEKIAAAGFNITKLYVPAKSLASESIHYPKKYNIIESFMNGRGQIIYLNVGDSLRIGDVTGKIIGPLYTDMMHPNDFAGLAVSKDEDSKKDPMYTYYENECALAAIFTCGNTKFFTSGDNLRTQSAYLVQKYGKQLNADIMKLSHHGTGSGNSPGLLGCVSPKYTFASNSGQTGINPDTKKWQTNVARRNSVKYGMCYFIANQKKTVIYHVKNNIIKVYTNKVSSSNLMKGWVKLAGADGEYRQSDYYYINQNGSPLTGVQKLGTDYYYFGTGGPMEYGGYDAAGNYLKWKSYNGKLRYFTLASDRQRAIMARGFTKVGNDTYYFNVKGIKLENGLRSEINKIGKYYYGFSKTGLVLMNKWATIAKNRYYFGRTGRMVADRKLKIGRSYYYFNKKGIMIKAKRGKELLKIGKYKYGVTKSGALVINNWATVGRHKYYFGKTGRMVKSKRIKIGKKYYYFGKTGKMVRSTRVKIGKYSYFFGKNAAMYQNRYVRIKGKKYYCQKNGVMRYMK